MLMERMLVSFGTVIDCEREGEHNIERLDQLIDYLTIFTGNLKQITLQHLDFRVEGV